MPTRRVCQSSKSAMVGVAGGPPLVIEGPGAGTGSEGGKGAEVAGVSQPPGRPRRHPWAGRRRRERRVDRSAGRPGTPMPVPRRDAGRHGAGRRRSWSGTAPGRGRAWPPRPQHGQGVGPVEVIEAAQSAWIELPQRRAELVGLALAGPDHGLMGPGQDLDRLGLITVAGDGPVVVGVGAGQLRQHPGVAGIGLGPRGRMTLPVARRRHGVDRQHV